MTALLLAGPESVGDQYRARLLDNDSDSALLLDLRSDPGIEVIDRRDVITAELRALKPSLTAEELSEPFRWAYLPWRRSLVALPGARAFRRLRLDRNRNKITRKEQDRLGRLRIGIVGLSVGHAIAHTLAMEGLCGHLRLADFDAVEVSNLNRIPATLLDLGVNKAIVAARRIAELDPDLTVEVFTAGLTESNLTAFFEGLDIVIEECDSLDVKVRIRQEAKTLGIPVLMETSDRGLLDVERFDLEPDRDLFHGLLGAVDPRSLRDLTMREKAPHVMRILQAPELSARMAASMVEIDRTVTTWPQLGGDVQLGAATIAAAVRRIGRGEELKSGRVRVDLDPCLDALHPPEGGSANADGGPSVDLTEQIPEDGLEAVIHAIRLAPSGGNSQPWSVTASTNSVEIRLVAERTSALDVNYRGSCVAIGAAMFNARVAAAWHHILGPVAVFDDVPDAAGLELTLATGGSTDSDLTSHFPAMIRRISNRNSGHHAPITDQQASALRAAAAAEGGRLRLIDDPGRLALLAGVLGESDRLRYLTADLHAEMMSELKWPGRDRLALGIDVRTLGLDDADLAKLQVAGRSDVMAYLAAWGAGEALGDNTRDRVSQSSAVAVITMPGDTAADYLRGGMAVEHVWVHATECHLGVQPISPVFLYARNDDDLQTLSPRYRSELATLQATFSDILELESTEAASLVLRLSHGAEPAVRSERLPREEIVVVH